MKSRIENGNNAGFMNLISFALHGVGSKSKVAEMAPLLCEMGIEIKGYLKHDRKKEVIKYGRNNKLE